MDTTRYVYQDEHRNELYAKVRVENGQDKSFYWEHTENGSTVKNIEGCRKVLYRLPDVLLGIKHNQIIFLVEGEKDAETLLKHGLIATTAPGSLEWSEEFTEILKDADIVILYDYDTTGVKRRDLIANALYNRVKRLRVVHLPGLEIREKHGQDITDWLAIPDNSLTQLQDLLAQTSDYKLAHDASLLRTVSLDELLSLNLPKREMLLAPFLPSQGLVMLFAQRGVGKTHVALGIAYAVASGGTFLRWTAPQRKNVLYIDGEMPAISMQERLQKIAATSTAKPTKDSLRILTPDLLLKEQTTPNLSCEKGRKAIEALLSGIDLLVVDNISCLFRSGSENEAESWQEAQEWLLYLRRQGISVVLVHHAGKNGSQRGTSKREDILDSIVLLKHPSNYTPEEGARFVISFDKSRHFFGKDAEPFSVHLQEQDDTWTWLISEAEQEEEEDLAEVIDLRKEGKSIRKIAQDMDLKKHEVEKMIKRAKKKGLLPK